MTPPIARPTGSLALRAAMLLLFASTVALILAMTLPHGWPRVGFEAMLFWTPVMFWTGGAFGAAAWVLSIAELRAGARRSRALALVAASTLLLLAWCAVLALA